MGTALYPPDFGDTDGAMSEVAVRNVWIVYGMALPPISSPFPVQPKMARAIFCQRRLDPM